MVLAAAADKAQDVKTLVERLSAEGRPEPVSHPEVHRPWGSYLGEDDIVRLGDIYGRT